MSAQQRVHGVDLHTVHQCRFLRVGAGHEDAAPAVLPRQVRQGQYAAHMAHGSVQTQLAHDKGVVQVGQELARGGEDAHGDGQVIGGTHLAQVGGGQVDGQAVVGEVEAAVGDGRTHAFAALAHGCVGQADNGDALQPAGDVDFHLYGQGIKADDGATVYFGKHEVPPRMAWRRKSVGGKYIRRRRSNGNAGANYSVGAVRLSMWRAGRKQA